MSREDLLLLHLLVVVFVEDILVLVGRTLAGTCDGQPNSVWILGSKYSEFFRAP